MANFKLNQTGEQIQADLDLLDSNSATEGQVLTANGTGGASWQNASGGSGGGTQLYLHTITGITIVNAKGNTLISSTDKIYAQSTISNSLADDGDALTLFKNGSTSFFNYRTSNYNYYIVSLKDTYTTLIDNTAAVILSGLTMRIGTITDTVTPL